MITVYVGDNWKAKNEAIASATGDELVERHDVDTITPEVFLSKVSSSGLFGTTGNVVLVETLGDETWWKTITSHAKALQSSPWQIYLLETKLLAKPKKDLAKTGITIQEFKNPKAKSSFTDNPVFKLTDAIGAKNKKSAWIMLQQVAASGSAPEESAGMIWWQLKTMMLAQRHDKNPGVKPFSWNKASGFAKNYARQELDDLAWNLVWQYHDSRFGGRDFGVELEKMVLGL